MAKRRREVTSVTHIMQTIVNSCDFGGIKGYPGETDDDKRTALLQEMVRVKSSDSGFGHLIDSILENGWDEDSLVGWDDDGYMNEGHHRFVAAILLCLDEIPTCNWGRNGARPGIDGDRFSAHDCISDPYPIHVEVF